MDTIPHSASQGNFTPETTFIYALVDPETSEVRYVGKANNPQERYRRHLRKQFEETHKTHWIDSLKHRGLKPILLVLEEVPIDSWSERERYWIEFYRQQNAPLTNLALGGAGGNPSLEARAEMSAKRKGKPSLLRGVKRPPYSPEWRANLSAGHKGKVYTPEQRANMGNARRGKPLSPETRAKIAASNTGKKHSPETRAKLSAARKTRVITPETREKLGASKRGKTYPNISKAAKGKKLSPESVAKRTATRKERYKPLSAETREKLRLANTGKSPSPETRAKLSKSGKGRVKSPEECQHISEAKTGVKRKPFTAQARANMAAATKRRYAMNKLPPPGTPTLWD